MKSEVMRHWVRRSTFAMSLALGGLVMFSSCEDEILTGQPSWLGESIYEQLQQYGNYQTTLRLIDSLNYTSVLSQTGSKTLFVADDEAWDRWFKTNDWGVREFKDLSKAQMKLLFNSSMINNAYLIELMSNVSGEIIRPGQCVRRATASTIYDSVARMMPDDMPKTVAWDKHRQKTDGIILMRDGQSKPMIHFLPAYMSQNKITDNDLARLTNGKATSTGEAWINGVQVLERDITCKNGYIHKVADVIEPSTNMAEIIEQDDRMSRWSQLLNRFSAPYYDNNITIEYNRLYNPGGERDSVFVMRYFSDWSAVGTLNTTPDGENVSSLLPFDPGWNQFIYKTPDNSGITMHYDAGMMIVPTDSVLEDWFSNGGGKPLYDEYNQCWDSVPDNMIKELLSVNMVETFSDQVPSKFDNVLDDAQLPLGIEEGHIKEVLMGCNGVVYLVNQVYTPSAYSSVAFPAMSHKESTMGIIDWAIENLEFKPYLNSMDSYYSLFLPTDSAMRYYIDPAFYGEPQQYLLEFYYDKKPASGTINVKARRYACTINVNEKGEVEVEKGRRVESDVASTVVQDRLEDLMNQVIIVENVENGYKYYKSKGGSYIAVEEAYPNSKKMKVQGGWQLTNGATIPVTNIYDMTKDGGNGKSYEIDQMMPLGSGKSVYQTLTEKDEYKEFLNLMNGSDSRNAKEGLLISSMGGSANDNYRCANFSGGNKNVSLFENYNYTVYVPTNESIRELIDAGYLPTWEDSEATFEIYNGDESTQEEKDEAAIKMDVIKERIQNFVRYHIQDNSIIIGGAPSKDPDGNYLTTVDYETMMINPDNGRFYSLNVTYTSNGLELKDGLGQPHEVITTPGLYNNICREYWLTKESTALPYNRTIYMDSDAIIHQIDGVLSYQKYLTLEEMVNTGETDYTKGPWEYEVEKRIAKAKEEKEKAEAEIEE